MLQNKELTLYWDKSILTDRTINYKNSEVILLDKNEKKCLIEVRDPLTKKK
jgi:hypothetical protein